MIPTTLWWRMVLTSSCHRRGDTHIGWMMMVVRWWCCSFQCQCFSALSKIYCSKSIYSTTFINTMSIYTVTLFWYLFLCVRHFKLFTIGNTSTVHCLQMSLKMNHFAPILWYTEYYTAFSMTLMRCRFLLL